MKKIIFLVYMITITVGLYAAVNKRIDVGSELMAKLKRVGTLTLDGMWPDGVSFDECSDPNKICVAQVDLWGINRFFQIYNRQDAQKFVNDSKGNLNIRSIAWLQYTLGKGEGLMIGGPGSEKPTIELLAALEEVQQDE